MSGFTRRELIEAALDEIGVASSQFDLSSDQMEMARRRLDVMLASMIGRGINLGAPLSSAADVTDLDDETNIVSSAIEAVILNLAVRLAPGFGREASFDTRASAKMAMSSLLNEAARPLEMQLNDSVPVGAGNKTPFEPFLDAPTETVDNTNGTTFGF